VWIPVDGFEGKPSWIEIRFFVLTGGPAIGLGSVVRVLGARGLFVTTAGTDEATVVVVGAGVAPGTPFCDGTEPTEVLSDCELPVAALLFGLN